MSERRVVCAAIRNTVSHIVICGPRHHHCFKMLSNVHFTVDDWQQGFVDQYNEYMDRFEALAVAESAGQLIRKTDPKDRLFSEDIY